MRRHATRLFREKTGLSIAGFQEQERIAQARRLLTETALPVGEIAWRAGFETGSALARAMRRVTGLTPTSV
ncbi:helix-turn-helix domain-containing protein, partial [Acinetobacter baumannii]|uniref:helix-turn-helix domain-containing protein n=1 Tax=Acinetobacter baumannii TaxID=470 RepID=UPI0013D78B0F